MSILSGVKEDIARIVTSENNKVRTNDIYSYFSKIVAEKGLSDSQKQQMIRKIISETHWADDPVYFRNMKEILTQIGVDFEFVIGKVQDYYEVNLLVGYNINGKNEYDYVYPPGEYETLSADEVRKKYKEGHIISKEERIKKSKLLIGILNKNDSNFNKGEENPR